MADSFRLVRSIFIQAPPAAVHALIEDFHRWEQWSPWVKMDAGHLSQTYEGPSSGVGSAYGWAGPRTGKGRMEILTSTPSHIGIALDFLAPMKRSNKADFTFTPENGGTKLEWSMSGPMGLFDQFMQIFFSMEKMIGPVFEQGLASIKILAESAAPKDAPKAASAPADAEPKANAAPKAAPRPAATKPAAKPVVKAAPAAKPPAKAKTPAKAKASAPEPVAAKPAAAKKAPAAKAKPAAKVKAAPKKP